jgi:hypothetical protein
VDWGYYHYQPREGGSKRLSYLPLDFSEDRKKMRSLALFDCDYMNAIGPTRLGYAGWVDTLLRGFGNVQKLTVVDRDHGVEGQCGELVIWHKVVHVEASLVAFMHPELMAAERYLKTEEVLKKLDWKHEKAVELKANIEVDALQRFHRMVNRRVRPTVWDSAGHSVEDCYDEGGLGAV